VITEAPAEIPDTVLPDTATLVLLLLQVPPATVLVKPMELPMQTLDPPEMAPATGKPVTVTEVVTEPHASV
jgi:hypothetical protein